MLQDISPFLYLITNLFHMKMIRQLVYAFAIAILFLLLHIAIAYFKVSDIATLVLTLSAMILSQVVAFLIVKKLYRGKIMSFTSIASFLIMVQVLEVILLSLNSAYNPFVDYKPINFGEIAISIVIFGIVFPFLVTTVIWFSVVRNKKRRTSEVQ
jgi:hypothetical protein